MGSVFAETWKGSSQRGVLDVAANVLREARIDLVEHVLAVVERPHLADRLVADAGHHAADVVQHGVHRPPLRLPVRLAARQLGPDGEALARFGIDGGHHVLRGGIVRHVVDAGADIDDRLEHGVTRHVRDALAIHPDFAAIADRLAVLIPGADHALLFPRIHAQATHWRRPAGWVIPNDEMCRPVRCDTRTNPDGVEGGSVAHQALVALRKGMTALPCK